jgi:NAD(P)H-flavin reductase
MQKDYLECSVKRVGLVTGAIHRLDPNALLGLRGPYGNSFPLKRMEGRDLLFVAGGIGLAALRSLIEVVLAERKKYGSILLLYGARTAADLVYREELEQWSNRKDLKTVLTVDPGGEDPTWKGEVGFVPAVLERINPSRKNSMAITCGPPIMIRYVLAALEKMDFDPEAVITTLEMKMKCGLGQCGRCNVGPLYVCKDGPVFTYAQIREFAEQII